MKDSYLILDEYVSIPMGYKINGKLAAQKCQSVPKCAHSEHISVPSASLVVVLSAW